jgi:universal stress protein A
MQHLPKIILLPTDFSACAEAAVNYGLKLAKQLDASVYILHAWTMPYSRWDEQRERPQDVPPQLAAAARAKLDARLAKLRIELPHVESLFYQGQPSDTILKAAADVKAELIVLGTHGRRGLTRVFEGSVTETVTRRSPCPVLAIRHAAEEHQVVSAGSPATR